jgi:hypothetical protein
MSYRMVGETTFAVKRWSRRTKERSFAALRMFRGRGVLLLNILNEVKDLSSSSVS